MGVPFSPEKWVSLFPLSLFSRTFTFTYDTGTATMTPDAWIAAEGIMGEYLTAHRSRIELPATEQHRVARIQDQRASTLPTQLKDQRTPGGMPRPLAQGIETLSGMSMEHVRVHYNSPKPSQLQAHAYAQGGDIHLASGQERHLPHEAWHVVQQAQGRVKPTMSVNGTQVNDNPALEREADVMGSRALRG